MTMAELKRNYLLLELDSSTLITYTYLTKCFPEINKEMLSDFSRCAIHFSNSSFFNISSLKKDGFRHELFNFSLGNWFYESLVKNLNDIGSVSFGKSAFLYSLKNKTPNKVDAIKNIFLDSCFVVMEIDDFIDFLYNRYSIQITQSELIEIVNNDVSLYYNKEMKCIYESKHTFYLDLNAEELER